jgi:hypothetical protein
VKGASPEEVRIALPYVRVLVPVLVLVLVLERALASLLTKRADS